MADVKKDLKDRWAQIMLIVLLVLLGIQIIPVMKFGTAALMVIGVIIVYLLGRVLFAYHGVKEEEASKGQYIDDKFLYHRPFHVVTKEVVPDDHGKPIPFKVDDAEPNTLVQFNVKHHRGKACGYIVPVGLRSIFAWGQVDRNTTFDVALNQNREAILVPNVPANSDPTIIEINMLSWQWQQEQTEAMQEPYNGDVSVETEPPVELVDAFSALKPEYGLVEITRHDKKSFPIAEAIEKTFKKAGWEQVNFNPEIWAVGSPHYKVGIEVIGSDESLVSGLTEALNQYGLQRYGVKPNITDAKWPVNKVTVRVGISD